MKKIDLESWNRRSHFEWFSEFADPSIALDVKIEVTPLISFCKKHGLSSFGTIMYLACKCVNSNRALLLRVKDENVYELDYANVAYTIMVDKSTFVNCRANTNVGFVEFLDEVKQNQIKFAGSGYVQKQFNDTSIINDIYCSCIPWVSFLSVKQPIPDKSNENKSIPRICWGKYFNEGEKIYTVFNISANHALVDGIDIASVCVDIQNNINHIDTLQLI